MRLRAVHHWLTPVIALVGACAPAERDVPLDAWITAEMGELHVPGLVAAAVDSGRVVWIGAYGLAHVDSNEPATDTTPFMIASVSKTITASVIMSLHADGKFGLDDDVNQYLPFSVRNPGHPTSPITFRQLLRHRSSLADNGDFYAPFWGTADGDPTTTLGSYLRDYQTPTGVTYDREKNFLKTAPDEDERYCNTCYALLGFLAEEISGVPFERLSDEVLFTPLEMSRTAWFLRDLTDSEPAMPYRFTRDSGYVAYGQNGYPDWPAGQLRTTITDFARFLSVYADGGAFNGLAVIDRSTIETLTPYDPELGFLTWFLWELRDGQVVYSHGGGDIGVRAHVALGRRDGRGVAVFTNGEAPVEGIAEEIYMAIDSLRAVTPEGL